METVIIEVSPKGAARWEAWLGERLLGTYKEPFCSAARVLLSEGMDPQTPLAMRHRVADIVSLRSLVGVAADLMVAEGDRPPHFRKYEAFADA
jgi:hypothetical protein